MAAWKLAGKTAVITGASSGIGAATALRLARAGMTVVAAARREDRLRELADQHPAITPYVLDVTDTAAVDTCAAWVDVTFGNCHALVNNAGIPGGAFRSRDDLDDALHTLDVNLSGSIRMMAAFGALLRASAPSRVVNVASVAGKLGVGPAAYAASKFGLVGFSEATSFSWANDGVTVCQLNPGFIVTEGFPQHQLRGSLAERILGTPEDVARAVHRALRDGPVEYTVPRWYRPLVTVRHVAAPLYRTVVSRLARAGGTRD